MSYFYMLVIYQFSTCIYTTLRYTTLHYTTLHYTTLHYTTLHYTTLHYTILLYYCSYHLYGPSPFTIISLLFGSTIILPLRPVTIQ